MEHISPMLPREKMLNFGITSLTDDELLALFLRTGTPGKRFHSGARAAATALVIYGLLTADLAEFKHVEGIGVAKYAQLKGIAELARRFYSVRMLEEDSLLTPDMTREFLQSQLTDARREIFMAIFLDNKNQC